MRKRRGQSFYCLVYAILAAFKAPGLQSVVCTYANIQLFFVFLSICSEKIYRFAYILIYKGQFEGKPLAFSFAE